MDSIHGIESMKEKHLINSWKNYAVFEKQLELNLKQLSSYDNYPNHWKVSLSILKNLQPKNILDIGCGCGSFFKVCKDNLPQLNYCGCDYSKDAINIAKATWSEGCFFVKDIMDFTNRDVEDCEIIYASALIDVSPRGDEMLEKILSLGIDKILLSRVKITNEKSYYTTYKAYDMIETCAYYHNIENLLAVFLKYKYDYQIISDHIYLKMS